MTKDNIRRQLYEKRKGMCYLLSISVRAAETLADFNPVFPQQEAVQDAQVSFVSTVIRTEYIPQKKGDLYMYRVQTVTAQSGFSLDLQSSMCTAGRIQCFRACASKSILEPCLSHTRAGFVHGRFQIFSRELLFAR